MLGAGDRRLRWWQRLQLLHRRNLVGRIGVLDERIAAGQSQAGGRSGEGEAEDRGAERPAAEGPRKKRTGRGTGAEAKGGDEVTVHYVGVGYKSKKEFDASWGGEPFTFALGGGQVITGWEYGIPGMKVGGRRELVIPGVLAYGPEGSPPEIGPNETLIFVIDLLGVK